MKKGSDIILTSYNKINSDFGVVANYNTIIKSYSDGTKKMVYSSYDKIKGTQKKSNSGVGNSSEEELERYKLINLSRVKQKIVDLAYENGCIKPWQYFVTLTFDKDVVGDRCDYDNVCKHLIKWLNNQKHQNKDLEYLFVCEVHKKGGYHFHGIVKGVTNWKLEKSVSPHTKKPIVINGTQIYNLTNYKLGFTTVSEIKNQEAVTVYISKYITKELLDIKNKKHYWSSKSLKLPTYEYYSSNLEEIKDYLKDKDIKYEKINEEDNFTTAYYSFRT